MAWRRRVRVEREGGGKVVLEIHMRPFMPGSRVVFFCWMEAGIWEGPWRRCRIRWTMSSVRRSHFVEVGER